MVVDTSALIAILLGEPNFEGLINALSRAERRDVSAATVLEASIVIFARNGSDGLDNLDLLLRRLHLCVHAFDEQQLASARDAFVRFGKGRHPAALNFGDCFAYGLAKHLSRPLLFTGTDFNQTDVDAALS